MEGTQAGMRVAEITSIWDMAPRSSQVHDIHCHKNLKILNIFIYLWLLNDIEDFRLT
jgi:hypothetical protein